MVSTSGQKRPKQNKWCLCSPDSSYIPVRLINNQPVLLAEENGSTDHWSLIVTETEKETPHQVRGTQIKVCLTAQWTLVSPFLSQ